MVSHQKFIFIQIVLFLSFFSSSAQTYIQFEENGLIDYNPFGALLCPADSLKSIKVFNQAKKLNIPEKHIISGCEARAEYICKKIAPLLLSDGCELGKIWIFAPSISGLVSKKQLSINSPMFEGEKVFWDYHVAPVYSVWNQNKIDTVVIDFSINSNELINYHDWLNSFNCPESIYTFTDDSYYLFNTLDGLELSQLQISKEYLESMNFNIDSTSIFKLRLPQNFPKVITGDFWSLGNDYSLVYSGLALNETAIYLLDKYYNDPLYESAKVELKKHVRELSLLHNLCLGKSVSLPSIIKEDSFEYYTARSIYWKNKF